MKSGYGNFLVGRRILLHENSWGGLTPPFSFKNKDANSYPLRRSRKGATRGLPTAPPGRHRRRSRRPPPPPPPLTAAASSGSAQPTPSHPPLLFLSSPSSLPRPSPSHHHHGRLLPTVGVSAPPCASFGPRCGYGLFLCGSGPRWARVDSTAVRAPAVVPTAPAANPAVGAAAGRCGPAGGPVLPRQRCVLRPAGGLPGADPARVAADPADDAAAGQGGPCGDVAPGGSSLRDAPPGQ